MPPSALDVERALVLARGTAARGMLGGVLLGLDSVDLDGRPTRERPVEVGHVVDGVPCASALQIVIDLAALVDDDTWEQILESALRKRLVAVAELEAELPRLAAERLPGTPRMRRVLARRPTGAPPTESLLETLTVQLARGVPELGELTRQYEVYDEHGLFVARVDLCKPEIGLFFELDGQHHKEQPAYDAARQTAIVAATGWLPGRFTWRQIRYTPKVSQRRMGAVARQAIARAPVRLPSSTWSRTTSTTTSR